VGGQDGAPQAATCNWWSKGAGRVAKCTEAARIGTVPAECVATSARPRRPAKLESGDVPPCQQPTR